ncbi:hypothetical protein [Natronobiforma cellulositropha]|uniref:hypothetical protein n=1 Tax=Natronobiforma cellulositropha TaxID=1679076 RepID=UPI0021D60BB5|nr:hypothetical protein [Natronobiforma cellulositropha]
MAMDALDYAAVVGILGLVAATQVLEGTLVAVLLAGFALSLSTWRLYGGRLWEALAWLAWVGTAVVTAFGPDSHPVLLAAFFTTMALGIALLFGSRLGLLPDLASDDAGTSDRA